MTRTVEYTDHFVDDDSVVIREAYFNAYTGDLFVKLDSGNMAGYRNVPGWAWDEFSGSASRGAYWNRKIKVFPGQSGDVVLVKHNAVVPAPVKEQQKYKISVDVSGVLEFTLLADDFNDAVEQVKKMVAEQKRLEYNVTGVNVVN